MCTVEELVLRGSSRYRRLRLCDDPDCKLRELAEKPIETLADRSDPPGLVLPSGAVAYVPSRKTRKKPGPRRFSVKKEKVS